MTPPDGWPLSIATLHRLPPAHLMNERTERYPGVHLRAVGPSVQKCILCRHYAACRS
jgi:hypothetical protein